MNKIKTKIDLKNHNLSFSENGYKHHLLALNRVKMVVDIATFQNEEFIKNSTIPFAQLPKSLKAKLNPL